MNGIINIGGTFSVELDGRSISAPPTAATAVLLLGLCVSGGAADRPALEHRLYPSATAGDRSNAFRQTLFRLRRWIGPDLIRADRRCVELLGHWRIDTGESELIRWQLAPGIQHEWMDQIREKFRSVAPIPVSTISLLSEVRNIAAHDREIARSILIAGNEILDLCSESEVWEAYRLTQPAAGSAYMAGEYFISRIRPLVRFWNLQEATRSAYRAYRIGLKRRSPTLCAEASSYLMFCLVEQGQDSDAEQWLHTLRRCEKLINTRLLVRNALFSYHWNIGNFDEAESEFEHASETPFGSRRSQLHFWSNGAVFFAETGQRSKSERCRSEAQRLLQPGFDIWAENNLELARICDLNRESSYQEAYRRAKVQIELMDAQANVSGRIYTLAELARAQAGMGDVGGARKTWASLESARLSQSVRLPVRVQRQMAALPF